MRLAEIRIYPVKSFRGDTFASAEVEPRGLAGDRRWLVVDAAGRFLTQRELPHMAVVGARNEPGGVALSVAIPPPGAAARYVTIWRDTVAAVPAGAEADAWLTSALGVPCSLVHQADPSSRPIAPAYAAQGDVVSFADGFPLLLTTTASLADLNRRLRAPVPMLRFRPSLVIEGAPPWAEDNWHRIRIGAAVFRVPKPCDRCIIPTIDQETGSRPDPEEPLRTLKTFRRDSSGRVLFGMNLVPEVCGAVRVGDAVEVAGGAGRRSDTGRALEATHGTGNL
jgi:uncharacterized protein YcbX